jgi:hypothetical protein
VISPSQIPIPDNTQRSPDTYVHSLGGIRTRSPSKLVTADLSVIPRDQREPTESANAHFIWGHISSLNGNNRKCIISVSKLLRKVGSSSILRGMLRDPDDLTATAATVCLLQRESETYSELLHKKLGQSTSVSASCV